MTTTRQGSRLLAVGLIIFILMAFAAGAVAAEFVADMIQKTSMGEFTGKVYVKGKNIRREATIMGHKQIMINRGDKRVTYVLMPQQRAYMEMRWRKQDEATNPSSIEDLKKQGKIKYLGKEKVNGYSCKKYEYISDDASGSPTIFWLSNKLDYPIKIESSSPQGRMTVIYKNIKTKKISESLFEIPSDYEKITMPMMPKMGN